MLILLLVVIGIILISCASSETYAPVSIENIQESILSKTPENIVKIEQVNTSETSEVNNVNISQYNYKGDYDNFDFIYTYGVDKERIINIVSTINPKYFEGVSELEVIYSNKQTTLDNVYGWYYSDNAKITIYDFNYSDNYIKRNILHELKHNFCLIKERDSFNRCLTANSYISNDFDNTELWYYCYHDEGCFLNTPIDEEYGFIK